MVDDALGTAAAILELTRVVGVFIIAGAPVSVEGIVMARRSRHLAFRDQLYEGLRRAGMPQD